MSLTSEELSPIDMPKHVFPPVMPPQPFEAVPLRELLLALVSKRLNEDCWPALERPKKRPPRDKRALDAWRVSEEKLFQNLSGGKLIAYAYVERTGHFRRIPRHYWNEFGSRLCTSGYIYDLKKGKTFNIEIDGSEVYVLDVSAKDWLIRQGISGLDAFCPEMLRMKPKSKPIRTAKYNWEQFAAEATHRLQAGQDRSPRPTEAELVRELSNWCSLTWDRCPDAKMIRKHLRAAQARLQSTSSRN